MTKLQITQICASFGIEREMQESKMAAQWQFIWDKINMSFDNTHYGNETYGNGISVAGNDTIGYTVTAFITIEGITRKQIAPVTGDIKAKINAELICEAISIALTKCAYMFGVGIGSEGGNKHKKPIFETEKTPLNKLEVMNKIGKDLEISPVTEKWREISASDFMQIQCTMKIVPSKDETKWTLKSGTIQEGGVYANLTDKEYLSYCKQWSLTINPLHAEMINKRKQ